MTPGQTEQNRNDDPRAAQPEEGLWRLSIAIVVILFISVYNSDGDNHNNHNYLSMPFQWLIGFIPGALYLNNATYAQTDDVNTVKPVTYGSFVQLSSTALKCNLHSGDHLVTTRGGNREVRNAYCSFPDTAAGTASEYDLESSFAISPYSESSASIRLETLRKFKPNKKDFGNIVRCGDAIRLNRPPGMLSSIGSVALSDLSSVITSNSGVEIVTGDRINQVKTKLNIVCLNKSVGDVWTTIDEVSFVNSHKQFENLAITVIKKKFDRSNCPRCPHHGSYDVGFAKSDVRQAIGFTAKPIVYIESEDEYDVGEKNDVKDEL